MQDTSSAGEENVLKEDTVTKNKVRAIAKIMRPGMFRCVQILNQKAGNNYLQKGMTYNRDIEHALISFACTFPPYDTTPLKGISEFSSGMVFAHLLATVEHFPLALKDLETSSQKWIEKLTNLKIIMQRMESYIKETGKTLITKDIDLIEIAKHESSIHILRFFQLVVAVFMQSPHKEDYIQTIMHLDQRSQHALVVIVQNAIGERMADISGSNTDNKIMEQIQQLTTENELLREEIKQLTAAEEKHKRQLLEARERIEELEDLQEKYRHSGTEAIRAAEIDQLRAMNDNLKQKLLQTVREHEQEISRAREENIFLQNRMLHFKEYQQTIENLKEQLADTQSDRERVSQQEREKRRLNRVIEEKQAIIRQLKEKLQQTSEKNYNMQQTELYMKIELQKKEVRFKQLENQVKNRLKIEPFSASSSTPVETNSHALDTEELDYLQEEIEKLRASSRKLEYENLKLKKKIEKAQAQQGEKKKLEKIIVDLSKSKDAEIEMLIVSLSELRTEYSRMHLLLTSKQ